MLAHFANDALKLKLIFTLEGGIAGFAPVWIKMVSSWLCVGLYVWVLIAPAVLTDREFSF